jgi:hypothetical protein
VEAGARRGGRRVPAGYGAAAVEAPAARRVNVANGLLRLETGGLAPHNPDFLSPVQVAAAYDPTAACPAIDRFLGDRLLEECVRVTHELAAYLLTPDNARGRSCSSAPEAPGSRRRSGSIAPSWGPRTSPPSPCTSSRRTGSPQRTSTGASPTSSPTSTRESCERARSSSRSRGRRDPGQTEARQEEVKRLTRAIIAASKGEIGLARSGARHGERVRDPRVHGSLSAQASGIPSLA